jgi:hypothetical protein
MSLRGGNVRWPLGRPRSDALDLTYPALRIIFVTAQACDGALAGRHRGLDAWSWLTSMLKVDCDRRQRINRND